LVEGINSIIIEINAVGEITFFNRFAQPDEKSRIVALSAAAAQTRPLTSSVNNYYPKLKYLRIENFKNTATIRNLNLL
jgi:hypothetical protein